MRPPALLAGVLPPRVRLAGALLAGALLAACTPEPRPEGPRPYPGELVPPGELPGAVLYRQRVSARFQTRQAAFEAVVQKKGPELLVIGLGPMGASRTFTIALRGREVTADYRSQEARALPPEHLLHDVERAFFRGLPGPLADGEHRAQDRGEQLVESWSGGRLLWRRFTRPEDDPPGELLIRYEGGWTPGAAPPRVRLENGWLGYALEIETVEARPLPE